MLWNLLGKFHSLLHKTVEGLLTVLVYLAIAVAIANRAGWLDRWIWFILEKEGKKVLNGARVTIGSFVIDWSELLQGKITLHASNVILHTPQRDEWKWDSPLIGRIGKATVECNALITVFHGVLLKREVPIEAYTIIVSDVQVFVERRNSVINVYLVSLFEKVKSWFCLINPRDGGGKISHFLCLMHPSLYNTPSLIQPCNCQIHRMQKS